MKKAKAGPEMAGECRIEAGERQGLPHRGWSSVGFAVHRNHVEI